MPGYSILISTKNRKVDLAYTLKEIQYLIERPDVECVIFDDGSTDGTSQMIEENFPKIHLRRNETSKGYLFCRNKMLNNTQSEFAISLDDDAHFLSKNPLELIQNHLEYKVHHKLLIQNMKQVYKSLIMRKFHM